MTRLLAIGMLAAALGAAPEPVTWSTPDTLTAVKPNGKFSVRLVAKIQAGWHLYSMKPLAEGPIATRLWLAEGQPFSLAGPIAATEPRAIHDASFGMEVEIYEGQAVFTLPVRAAGAAPAGPRKIVVHASYQTCDNKVCLPPRTISVDVPVTVAR